MDPALAVEVEEISRHRIINETIAKGGSDIQHFLEDLVIFVTGGSGFIGKQLIEKLLRAGNVRKIYMLLRPKKQKSIEERIAQLLEDPVFETLKKLKPDFGSKIVPVSGDAQELGLGIDDEHRNILQNEVEVIFHGAATINFTEALKKATLINVRGTRETLKLGLSCKKLKAFVHVSTAYTPATYSRAGQPVLEQFYGSPIPPETLIQFAENVDETKINNMTVALIEDWPNTYSFTKAVTEDLVRSMEGKMPICVMRPGIVIGAYREPSPGWIDQSAVYGATGFIIGGGLGVMHVYMADEKNKMGYVPVDLVNNAVIAGAYTTAERWTKGETDIKVYNIINSRNPITLEEEHRILAKDGKLILSDRMIYYIGAVGTRYQLIYTILTVILHFIPGYVVDFVLRLLGKEPILMKLYKKVYKLNDVLQYFMKNDWLFNDDNMLAMYKSLSPVDQTIFNCDIADLDWKRYIVIWCIGIRKYIIKDGLKNTNYAVKKEIFLRVLHYIVFPLYLYSLWKILYFAFCLLSSVISFVFHNLVAVM